MSQTTHRAHIVVLGNEKGGAGKSTIAIHIATALLHSGARLAVIDLDLRQQSVGHFFSNRAKWAAANGVELPMPQLPVSPEDAKALSAVTDAAEAKAARVRVGRFRSDRHARRRHPVVAHRPRQGGPHHHADE